MADPNQTGTGAENAAPELEKANKTILDLADDEIQAVAKALVDFKNKKAAEVGATGPKAPFYKKLAPRMLGCLLLVAILAGVVSLIAPQQVTIAVFKLLLVSTGGYLGYWLDRWLFPYSRPDGYLCSNWQGEKGGKQDVADHAVVPGYEQVFSAAMLRRALVMLGVMLAIGLGL